jgi:DNA-directed RNA polymerase subunit RPC12/RpoP
VTWDIQASHWSLSTFTYEGVFAMTNTNCLEGFRCPNCGSEAPFRIEVSTVVTFTDDGSTDTGADLEWQHDSYCECPACDHVAIVAAFRPTAERTEARVMTTTREGKLRTLAALDARCAELFEASKARGTAFDEYNRLHVKRLRIRDELDGE